MDEKSEQREFFKENGSKKTFILRLINRKPKHLEQVKKKQGLENLTRT